MTAKQATFELLDQMTDNYSFYTKSFAEVINESNGWAHFPATYLRYMREYRKKTGRRIVCVNKKKSLYKIGGLHYITI